MAKRIRSVAELERYIQDLQRKADKLCKRLADAGLPIASAGFASAAYDGTNDVKVEIEDNGAMHKAIVAIGGATLFIEYGTGVTYPDNHPKKAAGVLPRGAYGQGKGSQKTWGYYGDPGTNGEVREKQSGQSVVLTHGNPANMPMYNAAENMRQSLEQIVREVFGA